MAVWWLWLYGHISVSSFLSHWSVRLSVPVPYWFCSCSSVVKLEFMCCDTSNITFCIGFLCGIICASVRILGFFFPSSVTYHTCIWHGGFPPFTTLFPSIPLIKFIFLLFHYWHCPFECTVFFSVICCIVNLLVMSCFSLSWSTCISPSGSKFSCIANSIGSTLFQIWEYIA